MNLLLNRVGRLLDVESHLPCAGKVVLRVESARRVHVRLPFWVPRRDLRASLRG